MEGLLRFFWGRLGNPFALFPFPLSPSVPSDPSLQAGPSGSHQPCMLCCEGEWLCFLLDISLEYSGRCQQGAVAPHTWAPALCFCTTPVGPQVGGEGSNGLCWGQWLSHGPCGRVTLTARPGSKCWFTLGSRRGGVNVLGKAD